MIYRGKFKILYNDISACDYEFIENEIVRSIHDKNSLLISPIASYTLVLAFFNKELKNTLDKFDYLLPDSQWVKRSLFFLYKEKLVNRVYGPELMLKTIKNAEKDNFKIFFYGTTLKTLNRLRKEVKKKHPKLKIAGSKPSTYKNLSDNEKKELVSIIKGSNADIVFLGLGSPLQENFGAELKILLKKDNKNAIIIAAGAGFDFISKTKPQAPSIMQNSGFEWLFRLLNEPARLWKRYIIYSPLFIILIIKQKISLVLNKNY